MAKRKKLPAKKSLNGLDIGYSGLEPKHKMLVAGGVLAVVGITVWVIAAGNTARKQDAARQQALVPRTPHNWASRFSQAFYNNSPFKATGGTDEAAIWRILAELPTQASMQATSTAYAELYPGENLIADLQSELDTAEYNHFMTVLNRKPVR